MEREGTNRAQEVVARILAVKLPCAVQTEVAAYAVRVGRRGLPARGGREEGAAALLAGKAHVCRAARVACAPAERSSVEWLQEGDTKRQSVSAHRNMPDSPRSPPRHIFLVPFAQGTQSQNQTPDPRPGPWLPAAKHDEVREQNLWSSTGGWRVMRRPLVGTFCPRSRRARHASCDSLTHQRLERCTREWTGTIRLPRLQGRRDRLPAVCAPDRRGRPHGACRVAAVSSSQGGDATDEAPVGVEAEARKHDGWQHCKHDYLPVAASVGSRAGTRRQAHARRASHTPALLDLPEISLESLETFSLFCHCGREEET